MCLMSYVNNKGAYQPEHPRSLISAFVVRCLDSIISLRFYSPNFKTLGACRFVSGLVGNSQRHDFSWWGSYVFMENWRKLSFNYHQIPSLSVLLEFITYIIKRQKNRTPEKSTITILITKICLIWIFHRVMFPKDADGMANSVDRDQRSSLILVCTVCSDLSVRKLRIIIEPSVVLSR